MLPTVSIPDLEPAGVVDPVNDQLLIRQGLNDKRISPNNLFNFSFESFTTLNSPIVDSDVILVGRNDGFGAYTNYRTDPRRLGFLTGVTMWFYSDTAPLYWTIQPGLGNRVLAVKGGALAYANFGLQGTWLQTDAVLTVDQIPAHTHYTDTTNIWSGSGSASTTKVAGGRNGGPHEKYVASFPTGGVGSSRKTSSGDNDNPTEDLPVAAPHNHGSLWRPAATVGVICQKSG